MGENRKKPEPSYFAGGNVKLYSHFRKQFGSFLKKLNINLPLGASILFHISIQEKMCVCVCVCVSTKAYVNVGSNAIYKN